MVTSAHACNSANFFDYSGEHDLAVESVRILTPVTSHLRFDELPRQSSLAFHPSRSKTVPLSEWLSDHVSYPTSSHDCTVEKSPANDLSALLSHRDARRSCPVRIRSCCARDCQFAVVRSLQSS